MREVSGASILPVIGLGAGGHARVVVEILRARGEVCVVGLLDPNESLWNTRVLDVPVLGSDALLADLLTKGVRHVFVGVGSVGDMRPRRRLYDIAVGCGFEAISAVHPAAVVSPSASIGPGVTIMAGAVINTNARIGKNVLVNTAAVIEHDCGIGNHVHVATGARLASTVAVGDGTHIGLGAVVRQCVRIGRNVIVGAGAVVLEDVPDDVVVAGVPARILRKITAERPLPTADCG